MTKKNSIIVGYILSLTLYLLSSYLLLIRDHFLLERFSVLFKSPDLLTNLQHLSALLHANPASVVTLSLSIIGCFLFYALLIWHHRLIPPQIQYRIFFLAVTITLLSFPALSTDVFDYINSNRVAHIHHANPWITAPQNFPDDPHIYFGSWNFRASVYPPVLFVASSLIHFLFGSHVVASLIGFKLFNFFILSIILYILYRFSALTKTQIPPLILIGLNPLVLIEFLGNAHNDIFMGLFILLTFITFSQKRFLLSGFLLGLGFWTKFTIILFLPLLLSNLIIRRQFRPLIQLLLSLSIMLILGAVSMGSALWYLLLNLSLQMQLYLQSLPTIIRFLLRNILGESRDHLAIAFQRTLNLPLIALLIFFSTKHVRPQTLIRNSLLLMLLYLFLASPMLQPWYAIWFILLIPLTSHRRTRQAALLFTFTLMCHYLIRNFSFYFSPNHFAWQIILYLIMVMPPSFVLLCPQSCYNRFFKYFPI